MAIKDSTSSATCYSGLPAAKRMEYAREITVELLKERESVGVWQTQEGGIGRVYAQTAGDIECDD